MLISKIPTSHLENENKHLLNGGPVVGIVSGRRNCFAEDIFITKYRMRRGMNTAGNLKNLIKLGGVRPVDWKQTQYLIVD